MLLAVILVGAYLIGSVNFSILLFSLSGRGDPRSRFSGNAGAINVWRQAGLGWAALILLLDVTRAVALAWAALYCLPKAQVSWIGLALVVGNRYPCYHRFRGGKGVATYLGFTIPISPLGAVVSALVWTLFYRVTHLPFVASFLMIAILAAGTITALGFHPFSTIGVVATSFFLYFNHRKNVMDFLAVRKNPSDASN